MTRKRLARNEGLGMMNVPETQVLSFRSPIEKWVWGKLNYIFIFDDFTR